MERRLPLLCVAAVVAGVAVALCAALPGIAATSPGTPAPASSDRSGLDAWPGGLAGISLPRHRYAMHNGVPAPYTNFVNPLPATHATVERGRSVYERNCTSCHGERGAGDGPAAQSISPHPAYLALLSQMPIVQWDTFMYWTVAEGGAQFGTAMPAFKATLSKDDTWAVIAYIQAHLPRKAK